MVKMTLAKTTIILAVLVLSSGCLSGGITGRIIGSDAVERECRIWDGVMSLDLSGGVLFSEWWGEVDDSSFHGVMLSDVVMDGSSRDGVLSGSFSGVEPNTRTRFEGSFGGVVSNYSINGSLYGKAIMPSGELVFFTGELEGSCR